MSKELLSCLEINPQQPATASVIWLHGLGADGYDFANIVPELDLPSNLAIRFIFPHAPLRPVTINAGYTMRAWYDILGTDFNTREDEKGVRESEQVIYRLIENEHSKGIPYNRIMLAGFSQGGAIALHAGLRFPQRLAGIMALSTYLPLAPSFFKEANPANKDTPIFMAHGTQDPILPLQWGQISANFLKEAGHPLEFHIYQMPHGVCPEEIKDISKWLTENLNSN